MNCYQVINLLHVLSVPFIPFVRTLCTVYTFWDTTITFQVNVRFQMNVQLFAVLGKKWNVCFTLYVNL